MKILHIIASADPVGGGPIEGIVRQDAACRAANAGIYREVLSLDEKTASFLTDFPIQVHALGVKRTGSRLPWKRFLERWRYSSDFVPWLRSNISNFDVVVVNGLWNYAAFGSAQVLPKGHVPYFVFPHGMLDPWFKSAQRLKHAFKQISWLLAEGKLAANAKSLFFTSEEEKRKAKGTFLGYSYKGTVVGYGASPPPPKADALSAAFQAAAPSVIDRRYFLYLSRIHRKKGCDILLRGFSAVASLYPDLDLVVAGPDQTGWRPELEAIADELGIRHRVHWTGPLYGSAKWGAIYGAEAFVLPSHQENFGISVAEALGCGVPVLISNKVDIWREIEGANAGIVGADTEAGVRSCFDEWFSLSDLGRANMGASAKALFISRFDVSSTALKVAHEIRQKSIS